MVADGVGVNVGLSVGVGVSVAVDVGTLVGVAVRSDLLDAVGCGTGFIVGVANGAVVLERSRIGEEVASTFSAGEGATIGVADGEATSARSGMAVGCGVAMEVDVGDVGCGEVEEVGLAVGMIDSAVGVSTVTSPAVDTTSVPGEGDNCGVVASGVDGALVTHAAINNEPNTPDTKRMANRGALAVTPTSNRRMCNLPPWRFLAASRAI